MVFEYYVLFLVLLLYKLLFVVMLWHLFIVQIYLLLSMYIIRYNK